MRLCLGKERLINVKIKDGFLLHQVTGQTVVLPTGGELDLNVMITLNETGRFLWERLQNETDRESLVQALLAEYDVDAATARGCVDAFVDKLNDNGFLE